MRVRFISNWRKWWRMLSQQAFVAAAALQGAWLILDAEQRSSIPDDLITYGTLAIVCLGFIGRLVRQEKVAQ